MPKLIDLTNKKFGKLFVISRFKDNDKHTKWKCQCSCGNITIVTSDNLNKGIKSCGCSKIGSNAKNFSGYKDITGIFWSKIKSCAKVRNIDFNVTIQQVWDLFQNQNGKCALSGIKLYFAPNKKSKGIASLDRKDSSKGYTIDNIQWVYKDINKIKMDIHNATFIDLCHNISSHQKLIKDYYHNCPFCNCKLVHQEGIEICFDCGYSKC